MNLSFNLIHPLICWSIHFLSIRLLTCPSIHCSLFSHSSIHHSISCFVLSIHLFIYYQSIHLFYIHPSIHPSIQLFCSIYSVCLFIYLLYIFYLSINLLVCPSIHLSFISALSPSIHPSIHTSVSLSVLSILFIYYLSIHILYIYIYIYIYIYMLIYHLACLFNPSVLHFCSFSIHPSFIVAIVLFVCIF